VDWKVIGEGGRMVSNIKSGSMGGGKEKVTPSCAINKREEIWAKEGQENSNYLPKRT